VQLETQILGRNLSLLVTNTICLLGLSDQI